MECLGMEALLDRFGRGIDYRVLSEVVFGTWTIYVVICAQLLFQKCQLAHL